MSSYQTYIRNDELSRLRQQAERVQRAEAEMQRIREQTQARERNISQQYQNNLSSLNRTIQQLGNNNTREMERLRTETRSALGAQAAAFRDQLQREREAARAEIQAERTRTANEIANVNNRIDRTNRAVDGIRRATDTIARRVDSMAREYDRRFNEIAQREAGNKERAFLHSAELSDLLASIEALKPNKFTDGTEYTDLSSLLDSINQNIENGQYDAALALAQGNILNARHLFATLTVINEEFNDRLRRVRTLQSELRERIESYGDKAGNELIYPGKDGEEFRQQYDINEWSGGMFGRIVARFEEISERLENAEEDISIDLEEIERISLSLEHIEESITECDTFARNELIASYAVEETARTIYQALNDEGYSNVENGFVDGDERKPYPLVFDDGNGNTVSVVVSQGENPEQAVISFETFHDSKEPDEYIRRTTRDGINSALRDRGIEIEDVEHRDDCDKNPTSGDFIANSVAEYSQAVLERRNGDMARVIESI